MMKEFSYTAQNILLMAYMFEIEYDNDQFVYA